MYQNKIIIYDKSEGIRIDSYLNQVFKKYSRSIFRDAIKDSLITKNNKTIKPSDILKYNDKIEINRDFFYNNDILPEKVDLDIVYEDRNLAIINKPKNMIVHPSGRNNSNTLENALLYNFKNLSDISGEDRRGIVHRLDKDTTGLIIIAKNNLTHLFLKEQFMNHKIKKIYYAIVHNYFIDLEGNITTYITRDLRNKNKMMVSKIGKNAITNYKVLCQNKKYALVEVQILTGRTHQIRVHMSYIGHPLIKDTLYSNYKLNFDLDCLKLHCGIIGFKNLDSNYIEIKKMPNYDFMETLKKVGIDYVF